MLIQEEAWAILMCARSCPQLARAALYPCCLRTLFSILALGRLRSKAFKLEARNVMEQQRNPKAPALTSSLSLSLYLSLSLSLCLSLDLPHVFNHAE